MAIELPKEEENVWVKGVGSLLFLASIIPVMFLHAFIKFKAFIWLVSPVFPTWEIGKFQLYGLCIAFSVLTKSMSYKPRTANDERSISQTVKALLGLWGFPLIILLITYVVKRYIYGA